MTYDKKYHEGEYKTVGQAAVALDQGLHQDVGETMEGMSQGYDKEMRDVLEKNKNLNEYYVVVLRKKEPLNPNLPMSNVMRQWFVAPRISRPSASTLKKDYPLHDHDVWKVKDGEPLHQWTLPGPDAWGHIMNHKTDHDKDLVKWMVDYEKGLLK